MIIKIIAGSLFCVLAFFVFMALCLVAGLFLMEGFIHAAMKHKLKLRTLRRYVMTTKQEVSNGTQEG